MLQPLPHARFAVTSDDLVVFDLVRDRYLGLPGAIVPDGSPVALAGRLVLVHQDAIDGLVDMGFLEASDDVPADAIVIPTEAFSCEYRQAKVGFISDAIDLAIVGVVATWRMLRGRPCRVHVAERPKQLRPIDDHVVLHHLARLDRLRLIVPTPRRCLPSALLTSLWLQRKGIAAQIVFGVRTHPFEAHCWAEHAGIVLDDELDRIRTFTPISVGLP